MKLMICTAVAFSFALYTVSAQELQVLASDADGMTVEYLPHVQYKDVGLHGIRYEFAGATGLDISHAGTPDLRFRKELIALPGTEGHQVEILQIDYRDESDVRVVPVAAMRNTEDGYQEIYREGADYTVQGFLPGSIVQLENVGRSRDHVFGDLLLSPVQWNPTTRVARVYTRILFRVRYGSTGQPFISSPSALTMEVLNPKQAMEWTIPRTRSVSKSMTTTLADGIWYRFDVAQTGVYRLSRRWFSDAGIDVTSLDPRTIRLFGNGGRERPEQLDAARPDPLQEIAIEVVGGDDGQFDEGDYVQFFGQGLSGFAWNAATKRYEHFIHRFDDINTYLLNIGSTQGKRMNAGTALNEPTAYQPQWFTGREFEEEEVTNMQNSGKLWVGKRLVPSAGSASAMVYTRKLEGLVSSQPVRYRMQLASSSEANNSFSIRANDVALGVVDMGTVDFSTDTGDMAKLSGSREFIGSAQLTDDRSTLSITYSASPADRSRGGYVDWVEWTYARRFEPLNDELLFSAPDTTAVIQFVLNGFTMSDIQVYDITDCANVLRMADVQVSGGTVRFQAENTSGAPRQFLAVAAPALKTAGTPSTLEHSTLLTSEGAEYLIITNKALLEAADRLKAHRERPGEDFISSRVVTLESIYNEFNSGVTDLTAIRDFLAWAMEHWSVQPRYVLLLGDGHFDYRNYTTPEEIMVPVWESENSISRIASYASDDFFAKVVGVDPRVDLATGRLPVQSLDEANTVVDKIVSYETQPYFDPWKNRVTFVADDGWTSFSDTDRDQHTRQSESLARLIPKDIEQEKIYIVSYRTENTAQGRRKPDASDAIIDQINEGTLVLNYTGHGAHDIWAHERIFISDVTIPQLTNEDRLTFVSAATCTFGLYDAPGLRSGTELLLLEERGGAIGGLSSPRVVYSTENSQFNNEFFLHLLTNGREADGRAKRIGDAIFSAKQKYNKEPGAEKFHLFADPALRLALPRHRAAVERVLVNGVAVTGDTVQLMALSKVTFEGSVRKADSSLWDDFNGNVQLSLLDAERHVVVQEPQWNNYTYSMPGGLLYRGQASISDGRFAVDFIVPKDISYENNTGRIAMYFDNDEVDGAGFFLDLRVGGSDSTAVPDDEGPVAQLFMDSRDFVPGDQTGTDPLLLADLFDESGINTTGLGIGHDLEAWLEFGGKSVVLNSYYKGDIDSYQRGTVEYRLRNLLPGPHTLRLRAWDIFNNSTTVETHFVVAGGLSLQEIRNYPNPMNNGTTFTFRHNVLDPVVVEVLIYSRIGRLVKQIKAGELSSRVIEVPWDGNNSSGVPLSSGIYIYRIVCHTADFAMGSEASGKIIVVR